MMRIALGAVVAVSMFLGGAARGETPGLPGVPPHEPTAEETIERALEAFDVSASKVRSLRALARARGLLPTVTGSYVRDDLAVDLNASSTGDQNLRRQEATSNLTDNVGVSVQWDFRDLAFNPSEVDVYTLVGVQRDLILEVSRTYFLRQQLMIQRASDPPSEPKAKHILDLRIREFTTLLNAFTNGWFSAERHRRADREH